jgi:UDP-N-acetylmuramoyl-L-alanyl-D-glutamate--2,6-diaminopimelate ligase
MMAQSPQPRSVSLRALFPRAIFTAGEDIVVESCSRYVKKPLAKSTSHLFVAGVEAVGCDDEAVMSAVKLGAHAVLTERLLPIPVPQCVIGDVRTAYSQLLHALANAPSEKMLSVGVLGTHGKTSTSLLVASMLKKIAGHVAYWTSLGRNPETTGACDSVSPARLTHWLSKAVREKRPASVIELSDEMLVERTAAGLSFDVMVIPSLRKNQRSDAMESRGIEANIARSVKQLKEHGLVVYNADDARLNRFIERHEIPAIGYGLDADAHVRGKRLDRCSGSQTMMVSAGQSLMPITTPLVGDHALRHVLAAVAVGHAFGLELFEIISGIERLQAIPGRMQRLACGQNFGVYVDLADQADRLAVSLHSLAQLGGRVTCVAEVPDCATSEQRAAYGRVLSRAASRVLLTQSRQTTVAGQRAMWEVLDGCDNPAAVDLVPDRAAAIELALRSAGPGDQVLLAGWGSHPWTNNRDQQSQTDKKRAEEHLYAMANEPTEQYPAVANASGLRLLRNDD